MSKSVIILGAAVLIIGGIVIFNNKLEKTTIPFSATDISATYSTISTTNERRIVIDGHKMQNANLAVSVGTTVVFENKDNFQGLPYTSHTITTGKIDPSGQSGVVGIIPNSGSGIPDDLISVSLQKNMEFSFTFTEMGTVTFYISEHPLVSGQGMITVTAIKEKIVSEDDYKDISEGDAIDELINMDSRSFSFAPNVLQVKIGEQVDLDVASVGLHTFTIDELGIDIITPHGKTTRVSFIPDRIGTFEYYCAIPGHREAGQTGIIVVSNS